MLERRTRRTRPAPSTWAFIVMRVSLGDNEEMDERRKNMRAKIAAELTCNTLPEPGECCICLRPMRKEDEDTHTLSCKHSYHRNCIASWLIQSPEDVASCPLCRGSHISAGCDASPSSQDDA